MDFHQGFQNTGILPESQEDFLPPSYKKSWGREYRRSRCSGNQNEILQEHFKIGNHLCPCGKHQCECAFDDQSLPSYETAIHNLKSADLDNTDEIINIDHLINSNNPSLKSETISVDSNNTRIFIVSENI